MLPEIVNEESVSVQLETVRLNSVNTNNLVETLIQMVAKLTEEVGLLRKDNEFLKMKVGMLAAVQCSGSSPPVQPVQQSLVQRDVGKAGSSSSSTKECAETRIVSYQQRSTKSYAEVATSETQHALPAKTPKADEEFTVVSRKRARAPNPNAVPHKRTPMIGVRNASALSVVVKKGKTVSLFVSALVLR
jgi:hypothetical protein